MDEKNVVAWQEIQHHLKKTFPGFIQYEHDGALTLELDDEEWQLEITPQGMLICQVGYALDDMHSLLSDGTAEDLGSDELAKQAKFYIQQVASKYREDLLREGFAERTEMNSDYVAVFFERAIDLNNVSDLDQLISKYRQYFSKNRS